MSKPALEPILTIDPDEIPSAWQLASIPELVGDAGVFVDGDWVESKDQDPNGDVRLIQLADIGDGSYRNKSARFLTKAKSKELRCHFLAKGDVLIARMPDPLGRACIFPGDSKEAVTVVDVAFVRASNDEFSHKWLMYFTNSPVFRNAIDSLQSGTTRKRISRKNLGRLKLPVPPRDQQDRIVAEIEKQFSRLDEAVASLKRVKANLKRYKAAVLKAAVEGKLSSEPSSAFQPANFLPLSELIESLGQGWSPKCEREASLSDDDWGVIKTTAIQSMEFDSSENKKLPNDLEPRQKHEIVAGDMLITRAGPRKRVGVSCLVRSTRPRLMLCDKAYRLKLNLGLALPEYFELALNSPQIIDELDALKTGISDSGLNLTQKRFLELRLPIPALQQQEEIVKAVESKLSVIEKIELEFDRTESRLASSRQSILGQAFQGKLVDDEICAA